eukprot:comp19226_c0_seq1/m.21988 comp19226_c0_seq1/g.21988  ORF comp19226_c0_seq1/g.21988 comp19226_c0_seq1/m.21988 type:complete len:357 (-) comp19226_c0_seq1:186-1256(-)
MLLRTTFTSLAPSLQHAASVLGGRVVGCQVARGVIACGDGRRGYASHGLPMEIRPDVKAAIEQKKAVVALETSIISHVLPFPANLQLAADCERLAKEKGAVLAIIGVVDGKVNIGLTDGMLERFCKDAAEIIKVSKRDMALVIAKGTMGATTVSASMALADLSGIPILATVGVGGVQRGGEDTLDISSDLTELGRTPVAVVCSGILPTLDALRTVEFLETQGATTVTFGDTDDFPITICATSGANSTTHLENPSEFAKLIDAHLRLGLKTGTLIAVPPPEGVAVDPAKFKGAVDQALAESEYEDVKGYELTNFLLNRSNELMKIDLPLATAELLKYNVTKAAEIAVELSRLRTAYQ